MNEGIGIRLPYEAADAITLATLRESKTAVEEDIEMLENLKQKVKLENYQEQDLKYNKDLLLHLVAIIEYYGGTP